MSFHSEPASPINNKYKSKINSKFKTSTGISQQQFDQAIMELCNDSIDYKCVGCCVKISSGKFCRDCTVLKKGKKCINCESKKLSDEFEQIDSIICKTCFDAKLLNSDDNLDEVKSFLTVMIYGEQLDSIRKKYDLEIDKCSKEIQTIKQSIEAAFYEDPFQVTSKISKLQTKIERESRQSDCNLDYIKNLEAKIEKYERSQGFLHRIDTKIEELESIFDPLYEQGYDVEKIEDQIEKFREKRLATLRPCREKQKAATKGLAKHQSSLQEKRREASSKFVIDIEVAKFFIEKFNEGSMSKEKIILAIYEKLEKECDSIYSKIAQLDNFIGDRICSEALQKAEKRIRKGKKVTLVDLRPNDDPVYSFFKKFIVVCRKDDHTINLKKIVKSSKLIDLYRSQGTVKMSDKSFATSIEKILKDEGVTKSRTKAGMIYRGITISEDIDVEDEVDEDDDE